MQNQLHWLFILAGVWLIISPFVLDFAHVTVAFWNSIGLGFIIAMTALLTLVQGKR